MQCPVAGCVRRASYALNGRTECTVWGDRGGTKNHYATTREADKTKGVRKRSKQQQQKENTKMTTNVYPP